MTFIIDATDMPAEPEYHRPTDEEKRALQWEYTQRLRTQTVFDMPTRLVSREMYHNHGRGGVI